MSNVLDDLTIPIEVPSCTTPVSASLKKMSTNPKVEQQQEFFPQMEFDRHFLTWLSSVNSGLIVCSYKTNFVFSIGKTLDKTNGSDKLSFWMTQQMRPLGAFYSNNPNINEGKGMLYIGSCYKLISYSNEGQRESDQENLSDFDKNFMPRRVYMTNDIDMHDIVVDSSNQIYFVSPQFGCVGIPSESHSFKVYWKPDWISKIASEDRCHLNGLCLRDDKPRYVTCIARTNVRGAWRENREKEGVVWDIIENKLVSKGLCMPHSPRWYNDKLWVLNSGKGQFGYIDFDKEITSKMETYHPFVECAFIPGYLRGLTFTGKYAIVGSSQDRHEQTFAGLPLGKILKDNKISAKCGLFVIDLETFDVIHAFEFKGKIVEIYDVVGIPHCSRPRLEDLHDEAIITKYRIEH